MLNTIKNTLKKIFTVDESYQHKSLEEFIIRGNPQNPNDIDMLTRQYYNTQSAGVFNHFTAGGPHR